MKRTMFVIAAAVGLALAVPAAAEEQAANTPEKKAQEAAKKGADHLRWFVQRTRMIYGLTIYDFSVSE